MRRKLAATVLVVAGLCLAVVGGREWLDRRAASGVVDAFLEALRQGDRQAAITLLAPRQDGRGSAAYYDPVPWTPDAEFSWRMHQLTVDDRAAVAQLRIESGGFTIRPVVHLCRSDAGLWKIGRIENLEVDPRWNDHLEDRSRSAGEELADELARALQGRPGIEISRAPGEDRR